MTCQNGPVGLVQHHVLTKKLGGVGGNPLTETRSHRQCVRRCFPSLPLVGYGHGEDLGGRW